MKRDPFWLADRGDAPALAALLRSQPTMAGLEVDGETPAHHAAAAGHVEALRVLLDAGANPDARTTDGATPAWLAASKGHAPVIELLAMRGADLEDPDDEGITPLHLASCFGHRATAELLLKAGVQPNFKDAKANTPRDQAIAAGHEAIAELLRAVGAKPGTQIRMIDLKPPRNAGGKHRVPRVLPVTKDDPRMLAAHQEAAARLAELRELARNHPGHAYVKLSAGSEHLWCAILRVGERDFEVELISEPLAAELRGPRVRTIADHDVEDWIVSTSPTSFEGGFGERAMRQLAIEEYGTAPAEMPWARSAAPER